MPDIFSPEALAKSVHDTLGEALSAIPDGQHGAILVDGTYAEGQATARVLVVQKVGSGWSVMAGGEWDGHHPIGKVAVAGSWK